MSLISTNIFVIRSTNDVRHVAYRLAESGKHFISDSIPAKMSMSVPTHFRLWMRLATSVVPLPQKGSKTLSPIFVYFSMESSTKSEGNLATDVIVTHQARVGNCTASAAGSSTVRKSS